MSIPNIGVGSPITIANINEIINGLNKLALDVQNLQSRLDKAVASAAATGENSALYVVTQPYRTRSFTITASQASLPAKAVFTAADVVAIVQGGTNLLNEGFTVKVDKIERLGTRDIKVNIKVSKSNTAAKNPRPSENVKWKFDLDYEIPTN